MISVNKILYEGILEKILSKIPSNLFPSKVDDENFGNDIPDNVDDEKIIVDSKEINSLKNNKK